MYGRFAKVYDVFMDAIPYREWCDFVDERLCHYCGDKRGELLELGCGTGNATRILAKKGYYVTGIDLSEDMIDMAQRKRIGNASFFCQDMRVPFCEENYFDYAVSLCDSMNYLLNRSDVLLSFKAVDMALRQGGIFLFDMKKEEFYRDELGDGIFADRRRNLSYIWENHYDVDKRLNMYKITFYRRIFGGVWRSFKEVHRQRAYPVDLIVRIGENCGYRLLEVHDAGERNYFIFRKEG